MKKTLISLILFFAPVLTHAADLDMQGYNILNVSTITTQSDFVSIGQNMTANGGQSISIGYGASTNSVHGIGVGAFAGGNHDEGIGVGYFASDNNYGGVGIGASASGNWEGVGIGYFASDNGGGGVGVGTDASDNNNAGVGIGASARQNSSNGVGIGALAQGNSSFGIGIGNEASDNHDYGIGIGAYASSNVTCAIGIGVYSQGTYPYGTSVGAYTIAGSSSIALGAYARALGIESVAIGAGAQANAMHSVSLGAYTVNNATSSVKVRENYVLFVDSIAASGASYVTFSTGLFVNGNVGIGTNSPTSKLQVSDGAILSTGTGAGIYTTGTSTAAAFYGNGSTLSSIPLLGATQTFTGANTFSGQVTFSSTPIGAIPAGMISAFYLGVDGNGVGICPTGWLLCDGTHSTPDLRGLFIRGAGTSGTYKTSNETYYSGIYDHMQYDALQGHVHGAISTAGSGGGAAIASWTIAGASAGHNTNFGFTGTPLADATDGTPRVDIETRPADYPLTYCMKQ